MSITSKTFCHVPGVFRTGQQRSISWARLSGGGIVQEGAGFGAGGNGAGQVESDAPQELGVVGQRGSLLSKFAFPAAMSWSMRWCSGDCAAAAAARNRPHKPYKQRCCSKTDRGISAHPLGGEARQAAGGGVVRLGGRFSWVGS